MREENPVKLPPRTVLFTCLILLAAATVVGLVGNLTIIRGPLLTAVNPVASADAPLRFVIVAPLSNHPVWTQVAQGARLAGEQLHIDVEFTGPRHATVGEQVQLIDMATAAQVDGIITQGVPDPEVAQAIAKAVDRGIPVVTVESDVTEGPTRRLAYVGSDNYHAGRLAAEELILRTGGNAVVGIVRGHFGPEEKDLRVRGFRDGLVGAPGIKVAAVESSDLNRTVAGQKALKMLKEHPDITALYATTALDSLGVAQSVTALGLRGRVLLVGWDSIGGSDDPLMRGALQVAVVQDPVAMGRRAVEVLEAYLRRDARPLPAVYLPITIRVGGGAL